MSGIECMSAEGYPELLEELVENLIDVLLSLDSSMSLLMFSAHSVL